MNNNNIFFFILIITCVYSQDYFQDCTGNSIDCTDPRIHCVGANWYDTIQSAIDDFNSAYCNTEFDCVVLIEDGIYNENLKIEDINITLASNFICDNDITHRDNTIINGSVLDPTPPDKSSGIFISSSNDNPITPSIIGLTIKDGLGTLLNFILNPDIDEDFLLVGGGITMINSFPTIRFNKFLSNGFRSGEDDIIEGSSYGGALSGFIGSGIGVGREIILDQDIVDIDNIIANRPDEIFFSNNLFNGNYSDIGKSVYLFGYGNDINMENSSFDVFYEDELGFIDVSEYWIIVDDTTGISFENSDGDGIAIADDIWVDKESNIPGDGDGSINNPFKTITRALETIYVPANEEQKNIYISNSEYIYDPDYDIFPLHLIDKVALIGDIDQRVPTILNANGKANTIIIENSQEVSIENLQIISGKNDENGGAIICKNSSVEILNIQISDSEAKNGGGIYSKNSDILMDGVDISGNTAYQSGGGIFSDNSTLILSYSNVGDNVASLGGGIFSKQSQLDCSQSVITRNDSKDEYNYYQRGGGIYLENTQLHIDDSTSINNNKGSEGGGIYVTDNSLLITENSNINNNYAFYADGAGIYLFNSMIQLNTTNISNNYCIDAGGRGAGLYIDQVMGDSCVINNCIINNNNAVANLGGGVYLSNSDLLIQNSIFSGNNAQFGGSGMYIMESSPEIIDCIFNNNITGAGYGGGISVAGGPTSISIPKFNRTLIHNNTGLYGGGVSIGIHSTPEFIHCDLIENIATVYGGGIYVSSNTGSFIMINTVIYNNIALSGEIHFHHTSPYQLSYIFKSFITNGALGITGTLQNPPEINYDEDDDLSGDPMIETDFTLLEDSPCIDAGIDNVYINDELIFSNEDYFGEAPDIGFIEFEIMLLLGDVNLDGSINVQDIVMIVSFILEIIIPTEEQIFVSDINVDGIVDILDIILLVSIILD